MRIHAVSVGLAASILSAACALGPAQADPRFGVCREQVTDYVKRELGQTPTRVEIQSYAERMPAIGMFDAGNALVYVKECDGFHSFEVRGTWSYCENLPHYGNTGSVIRYEGAFEGCSTG